MALRLPHPHALVPALRASRALAVVVALVAALLGAALVDGRAASARTAAHSRTSYETHIAATVAHMINNERRIHHLRPLTTSSQLQTSARRHNFTMSQFNTMSHQLPHEAFFGTRMRAAGYRWKWAGENIGWNSQMNTPGVTRLESLMYNEKPPNDGHRLNILNAHFRNVGVDVYIDRAHHKVWLTTDFGQR